MIKKWSLKERQVLEQHHLEQLLPEQTLGRLNMQRLIENINELFSCLVITAIYELQKSDANYIQVTEIRLILILGFPFSCMMND